MNIKFELNCNFVVFKCTHMLHFSGILSSTDKPINHQIDCVSTSTNPSSSPSYSARWLLCQRVKLTLLLIHIQCVTSAHWSLLRIWIRHYVSCVNSSQDSHSVSLKRWTLLSHSWMMLVVRYGRSCSHQSSVSKRHREYQRVRQAPSQHN